VCTLYKLLPVQKWNKFILIIHSAMCDMSFFREHVRYVFFHPATLQYFGLEYQ